MDDFNLAYWDWTPEDTGVFSNAWLGTPDYMSTQVNVTGSLFNEWPVLFHGHYMAYVLRRTLGIVTSDCATLRAVRDIKVDRKPDNYVQLQRGSICAESPFLPSGDPISMALIATKYADNNQPQDGFIKRLEGFAELCAGNSPTCIAGGGNNNLHNAVHIYLSGHMRDVATASNDPIFFLHHANIDRIFEAWLRKFNGNLPDYLPMNTPAQHPGHNYNDILCLLYTSPTPRDS